MFWYRLVGNEVRRPINSLLALRRRFPHSRSGTRNLFAALDDNAVGTDRLRIVEIQGCRKLFPSYASLAGMSILGEPSSRCSEITVSRRNGHCSVCFGLVLAAGSLPGAVVWLFYSFAPSWRSVERGG
jgi:hypothetical protein